MSWTIAQLWYIYEEKYYCIKNVIKKLKCQQMMRGANEKPKPSFVRKIYKEKRYSQ